MPPAKASQLQSASSGHSIIFGVRPEHIHSRSEVREATDGQIARVNVDVVEPLGSEVYAYLSTDSNGAAKVVTARAEATEAAGSAGVAVAHEFIARMDAASQPRPGESIEAVFDTDHLHVFDRETEQALA